MAVYTYSGNVYSWDNTTKIKVIASGETVILSQGEHADFTPEELDRVDNRFVMSAGAGTSAGLRVVDSDVQLTEGLLSDRPSASSRRGRFYLATDEVGGTLYRSDGIDWQPIGASGRELDYAEITTNVGSLVSTSGDDIPGLSISVPVGVRPIKLIFDCQGATNTTASAAFDVQITNSSNTVLAFSRITNPSGGSIVVPLHREVRLSPSEGTHDYKIRYKVSSGTGAIHASATSPAFLQAIEI